MKKIDRSSKVRTGFHQAKWDEPVIFELSRPGERGILVPQAAEAVKRAKALGFRTVLATNPIFPAVATESRVRWAGLQPEDFALITTYEDTRHCKPNPDYYRDILERLRLSPEECLMVGNDATEDLAAASAGLEVFLLTDCLINREGKDLTPYPHGGFEELLAYLER